MRDLDWAEIFIIAMAKLAPVGMELNPDDVVSLPMERVLIDHRAANAVTFSWVSVDQANDIARRELLKGDPAGKTELQGRYMKLTAILLWKCARDGITLTERDMELIPEDKFLFEDGIEYKWLGREEGMRLKRREHEHSGRQIMTKVFS